MPRHGTFHENWDVPSQALSAATVIQSILFFVLGFLSATFLALMIAPAVWRRAVALTRRRIEATVPMTLNEIQAEKDRMRAEYAMTIRRLEMNVQAQKEKAAAQVVEINRQREEIKLLADECAAKSQAIAELEVRASEVGTERRKTDERVQKLEEQVTEAGRRLEERAIEMEELHRLLDEANFTASNRQIELVARETEVDKLVGDINILRGQLRETEKRVREISAEGKATQEALQAERLRAAELEKKIERMMAELSDRDEKIERREREIERLRAGIKDAQHLQQELKVRMKEIENQRDRLQASLAEGSLLSMNDAAYPHGVANGASASGDQAQGRGNLQERLATLARENKRLRAALSNAERAQPGERQDDILRAQIHSLAAEVVNLTALIEGQGSPIHQVLKKAGIQPAVTNEKGEPIVSLAERIRALQKAVPQQKSSLQS